VLVIAKRTLGPSGKADLSEPNKTEAKIMIEKEIEAILAWQDVGAGDIDVDGVLKAFERLNSIATEIDLPALVVAIQSPKNNFWTRELFAEPISHLGGTDYLEPLLEAAQLGLDEGHDNDGFDGHLSTLPIASPKSVAPNLKSYWHEMILNIVN
jgi:hypothetical protein